MRQQTLTAIRRALFTMIVGITPLGAAPLHAQSFQVGIDFTTVIPRGEFKQNIENNGYGASGNFLVALGRSPLLGGSGCGVRELWLGEPASTPQQQYPGHHRQGRDKQQHRPDPFSIASPAAKRSGKALCRWLGRIQIPVYEYYGYRRLGRGTLGGHNESERLRVQLWRWRGRAVSTRWPWG